MNHEPKVVELFHTPAMLLLSVMAPSLKAKALATFLGSLMALSVLLLLKVTLVPTKFPGRGMSIPTNPKLFGPGVTPIPLKKKLLGLTLVSFVRT